MKLLGFFFVSLLAFASKTAEARENTVFFSGDWAQSQLQIFEGPELSKKGEVKGASLILSQRWPYFSGDVAVGFKQEDLRAGRTLLSNRYLYVEASPMLNLFNYFETGPLLSFALSEDMSYSEKNSRAVNDPIAVFYGGKAYLKYAAKSWAVRLGYRYLQDLDLKDRSVTSHFAMLEFGFNVDPEPKAKKPTSEPLL